MLFSDRDVTFALSGEEERSFPPDLVPRITSVAELPTVGHAVSPMRGRVVPRPAGDVDALFIAPSPEHNPPATSASMSQATQQQQQQQQ
jgi:hypothetical protein